MTCCIHLLCRDYQHLDKMQGCAPSFSLNPLLWGGNIISTAYVDLATGKRIDISDTVDSMKSTYAQTISRNKYSVVGVAQPPFSTSTSSPYRSTGFMSETTLFRKDPANIDGGTSVFKSCKTIDQCFIDQFTYNGKPVKRRVFDPVTKTMRDWTGLDGQYCGIFGILLSDVASFNAMCKGEDFDKKYCCFMDAAVTPLFYMFHYHWDDPITKKVINTCDGGSAASAIQNHLANMGAVYTTSKTDNKERTQRLSSIKGRLNQILDEFTQGSRSSPTSPLQTSAADYMRAMDCSVSLYEAMQAFTSCRSRIEDSNPFCTSYAVSENARCVVVVLVHMRLMN